MSTAAVPVIYTDSTRTQVIESGHIEAGGAGDSAAMQARIAAMAQANTPIAIDLPGKGRNYIFYEESLVITQLRYFPYVQLVILALFLIVAYALFSIFRNAEQNQVWVGMAKETAHQLGTPLSSLMAWMELLKAKGVDPEALNEMRKDVDRLEVITERFSKIGSAPDLDAREAVPHPARHGAVPASAPAFEPVIEVVHPAGPRTARAVEPRALQLGDREPDPQRDRCHGRRRVHHHRDRSATATQVHIDVTDTGKGIPASQQPHRVPTRLHHQEARLGPGALA